MSVMDHSIGRLKRPLCRLSTSTEDARIRPGPGSLQSEWSDTNTRRSIAVSASTWRLR